jgi:hypothetical protein
VQNSNDVNLSVAKENTQPVLNIELPGDSGIAVKGNLS